MLRIPVDLTVEYLGTKDASRFTRPTGEVVEVPQRVTFMYLADDGEVTLVPVSGAQLDKCQPPFDHASLSKGDTVRLHGLVVLQDRGSDRDSYFSVQRVDPVKSGKLAAAA